MNALWQYSTIHKSACKVIEEKILWGQTVCRVWLPNQDTLVRFSEILLLMRIMKGGSQ